MLCDIYRKLNGGGTYCVDSSNGKKTKTKQKKPRTIDQFVNKLNSGETKIMWNLALKKTRKQQMRERSNRQHPVQHQRQKATYPHQRPTLHLLWLQHQHRQHRMPKRSCRRDRKFHYPNSTWRSFFLNLQGLDIEIVKYSRS